MFPKVFLAAFLLPVRSKATNCTTYTYYDCPMSESCSWNEIAEQCQKDYSTRYTTMLNTSSSWFFDSSDCTKKRSSNCFWSCNRLPTCRFVYVKLKKDDKPCAFLLCNTSNPAPANKPSPKFVGFRAVRAVEVTESDATSVAPKTDDIMMTTTISTAAHNLGFLSPRGRIDPIVESPNTTETIPETDIVLVSTSTETSSPNPSAPTTRAPQLPTEIAIKVAAIVSTTVSSTVYATTLVSTTTTNFKNKTTISPLPYVLPMIGVFLLSLAIYIFYKCYYRYTKKATDKSLLQPEGAAAGNTVEETLEPKVAGEASPDNGAPPKQPDATNSA